MAHDVRTFTGPSPPKKIGGSWRDLLAKNQDALQAASTRLRPGPSTPQVTAIMTAGSRFHSAQHQMDVLAERNACLEKKVAELTRDEERARYLALHDPLTKLPNRRLLEDRFQQAIANANRHGKSLALLMLDLDGFKWVNDKLGHAMGDNLLIAVVRRLTAGIRGGDTACRYGGDEFVLMLPEIDMPDTAAAVAIKVRARLGEIYTIGNCRIRTTVSVGTAVYPNDGQSYHELLARADTAMYRCKSAPRAGMSIMMPLSHDDVFESGTRGMISASDTDHLGDSSFFATDEATYAAS